MASYSRLSALDRSFLDIEDRNTHMHVGATCVFDVGPLRAADGGIDIERVRAYVESRLHLIPRYRQHIAHIPIEGHPVWVDDAQFDIRYHVRHLSIPRPGCDRELKRLAGWINSQQLDRGKPLWEMWVIEGLENDRFALIAKTHHCMIDGLAGADLMAVLLEPGPDTPFGEPHRWRPRPTPSRSRLMRDAAIRRMMLPLRIARSLVTDPAGAWSNVSDLASALIETTTAALQPGSETRLNRAIGSHRRFDWLTFDLDTVKAVKNRLGGTVNDVVLAVVSGGLRNYLTNRDVSIDLDPGFVFRAFCPVGLQRSQRGAAGGNFVSAMVTDLPVGEPDRRKRLQRIRDFTRSHKDGAPVRGTEVLETIADEVYPPMLATFASMIESSRAYNIVVTNVPGPQLPLYLLGSQMVQSYPLVPLFGHQGVGIALLSYDGKLCWGFSADRDVVPDLHDLVECLQREFDQLCTLAGLPVARSARLRSVSSDEAVETAWPATAGEFAGEQAAAVGS
ncbi:MAG TPA: wax ester/triacylglycerol synthase family O-acyltransferase [Candidatus Limnocylindrales bacterium]|nr:wax ester/triacylglycerol synthase family O-acyltransferase [Candidatus Limnocylindrales bacterium]